MKAVTRIEAKIVIFGKGISETEVVNIIDNALSKAGIDSGIYYFLSPKTKSEQVSRKEFEEEADRDYDEIFPKKQ